MVIKKHISIIIKNNSFRHHLRGLFVIVSRGLCIVIFEFVGAAGAIGKGIDRCRDFLLVGFGLIAVTFFVGGLNDA